MDQKMIKLMKSTFYDEQSTKNKLAKFIIGAEKLSMGKECQKFEKAFAHKQERRYALFVSNGSMANLVLIQAMLNLGKIKKGDPVGVSALTWATNIMPLIQLGLNPVIIDCELSSLNISMKLLKNAGTIKALFLTNVLGFSDDITDIREYCTENSILFLEDNCESLGSKVGGKLLGNFGLASTFSSFVGHHLSTIEGGMVCTDNEELHNMLIMVRAHGWDRNLPPEKQKELKLQNSISDFHARYAFYDLAYNARPTEINGLIGNIQIRFWDEIVSKRKTNFEKFQSVIKKNEDFYQLETSHMDIVSNFAMPVVCKTAKLFEKYQQKFEQNEVEIRPIIAGDMSKQPFFKKYIKNQPSCSNADLIHKQGFYFPNNPELTSEEMDIITSLLRK